MAAVVLDEYPPVLPAQVRARDDAVAVEHLDLCLRCGQSRTDQQQSCVCLGRRRGAPADEGEYPFQVAGTSVARCVAATSWMSRTLNPVALQSASSASTHAVVGR
ncbi:hypothetical protein [Rhodococcus zopfii]|uniref:hypothetical protein n=1 Tax=Rhodococcus zopfii TaxID=43772 RepID=UPI003526C77D